MSEKIKELIGDRPGWGADHYVDGIITYTTEKSGDDFDDAFKRIEKELGIQTQRVKHDRDADIICNFDDDLIDDKWAGVTRYKRRKDGTKYTELEVVSDRWYTQSTVVHEVGHALGMTHPEDHSREDTIMSYGMPGAWPWFTALDIQVIDYMY